MECMLSGMRFCALCYLMLGLSSLARSAERVDFGYAFAPPHRITVGRPGASEKTLLDLEPGALTVGWSYDDLRNTPLAILKIPRTEWRVRIYPLLDGRSFADHRWTRGEGFLPVLDTVYQDPAGTLQLETVGAASGALIRVVIRNTDSRPHRFTLKAEVQSGWVAHNPAWMEPGGDPDALLACQMDRPDRVLMFGLAPRTSPAEARAFTLEWTVESGRTETGWVVRPYRAHREDLARLRASGWDSEFSAARKEWTDLMARAVRLHIPDAAVRNAFYASLGDLFIMREPLAKGYVGTLCGTEGYRSTNPFEPSITAIALDQTGFHAEAADGLRVHLDMQEADGNWADPKGWAHHMWGASGMKAWAAMEHFRLTGDWAYLESLYPRLLASSRWQEQQRAKTRKNDGAVRPATYGLMPRGMGDGGLMNGSDYFGVFYPHNILAVYADRLAVEAAGILGRQEASELRRIYETGLADLRASLEQGAIEEDGIRWMPGSPRNPSGSRWGVLYALFPAGILEPQHPLISGTLLKIERALSPGGQPVHTGWMPDGTWPAISLDNLAETHLVRGESDPAIAYLYSTLNHGTPLYTWCEERGLEPGSKKTSGDRQHLWTPLSVVRYLRDALVMEQGADLHLALGTARTWLEEGKTLGMENAPTHFGEVRYQLASEIQRGTLRAKIYPPSRNPARKIVLHLRCPQVAVMRRVTVNGKPWKDFDPSREVVTLPGASGQLEVVAYY